MARKDRKEKLNYQRTNEGVVSDIINPIAARKYGEVVGDAERFEVLTDNWVEVMKHYEQIGFTEKQGRRAFRRLAENLQVGASYKDAYQGGSTECDRRRLGLA